MRTRRSLVALSGLLLVVAAACGSDDEDGGGAASEVPELSSEEQEYADAFAETLQDDEDGLAATPDEAECMAAAVMDELGVDPFQEAGVEADDIVADDTNSSPGELLGDGAVSDEQADAILDVWEGDCVDLVALMSESAGSDFGLDPEGAACFEDGLREGGLARELLRPAFTAQDAEPDSEALNALVALLDDCGYEDGS